MRNTRAAHPEQPFFLYLAYDTPHAKLQLPPCAFPAGGGLKGGVQWVGKPGAMINTAKGTMDGWMYPDIEKATWDNDHNAATPEVPWPDVQKRYATDVRRIDDCVGDLLQLLKDLKIDENTLVVFSSDNGPSMESYLPEEPYAPTFFRGFGPFDGIKRDTWEGGVRVPTLARWPGSIPAGRESADPSGQWDWLATFAELAGIPVPAASDGVSLLPCLTGNGRRRAGTIYMEYFQNGRTPNYPEFAPAHQDRHRGQMQVVRVEGYKGIRYNIKSPDDDFEIYDVATDSQETNNLAGHPGFTHLQARMKARVLQVRKPDRSATRPYDESLVPPVMAEPKSAPGLTRSVFLGEWPWVPDFRTLTPAAQAESGGVELPSMKPGEKFGVAFEGFFRADEDGEYTFTLETDTGAVLFMHDIRVVEERIRDSAGTMTGSVRLKAGWHPLRLYSRHASTPVRLRLTCRLAEGQRVELSVDKLRQATQRQPD